MKQRELNLLNCLYELGEINLDYLSEKGCNKLNELQDKAEEENIIY